jgi:pyrroline-5-carboxylate reductase
VLKESGFNGIVHKAVEAAMRHSQEMAKGG